MAKTKFPTSMQEACEMLYAQLSKEEVELIKQCKLTMTDFHFSLGLWMRNQWIYKGLKAADLGLNEPFLDMNADMLSDEILNYLFDYIRNNK